MRVKLIQWDINPIRGDDFESIMNKELEELEKDHVVLDVKFSEYVIPHAYDTRWGYTALILYKAKK